MVLVAVLRMYVLATGLFYANFISLLCLTTRCTLSLFPSTPIKLPWLPMSLCTVRVHVEIMFPILVVQPCILLLSIILNLHTKAAILHPTKAEAFKGLIANTLKGQTAAIQAACIPVALAMVTAVIHTAIPIMAMEEEVKRDTRGRKAATRQLLC